MYNKSSFCPIFLITIYNAVRKIFNRSAGVIGFLNRYYFIFTHLVSHHKFLASSEFLLLSREITSATLASHMIVDHDIASFEYHLEFGSMRHMEPYPTVKECTALPLFSIKPNISRAANYRIFCVDTLLKHLDTFGSFLAKRPHNGTDWIPSLIAKTPHWLFLLVRPAIASFQPGYIRTRKSERTNHFEHLYTGQFSFDFFRTN